MQAYCLEMVKASAAHRAHHNSHHRRLKMKRLSESATNQNLSFPTKKVALDTQKTVRERKQRHEYWNNKRNRQGIIV